MCVGGSDNHPNENNMYNGSSRGPVGSFNRLAPTLTAPAIDTSENPDGIHSSYSDGATSGRNCSIIKDYYYGTSMACPAVAGCASLVRQYYTDGYYPSGVATGGDSFTPTAALIKASLVNSTDNMTGDPADRPSNDQGWGRVNLDSTLYFSGDAKDLEVMDHTSGLSTGQNYVKGVNVGSNSIPLKVTLVWTDQAGDNLVNNLNLTVTNGTTTWYGNNFTNSWSNTSTSTDSLNPIECVMLQNGTFPTGSYTITVNAQNVPDGEDPGDYQPFALVITGDLGPTDTPTPSPTGPTPTFTQTPTPTQTPVCRDETLFLMDNDCVAGTINFYICDPDSADIYIGTTANGFCPTDCDPEDECKIGWAWDTGDNPGLHWQYYFTDALTLHCTEDVEFDLCYGFDGYDINLQADFFVYWRCADGSVADCTTLTTSGPTGDWQLAWSDAGTNWTTVCTSRTIAGQTINIPCSCDSIQVAVGVHFDTYGDVYGLGYFHLYYDTCGTQCSAGERDCSGTATPTPAPICPPGSIWGQAP